MDLIEFLFGAKKEEPNKKPKKKNRKKHSEQLRVRKDAVQIKETNDIFKNKSPENLPKMEEEIRNKN